MGTVAVQLLFITMSLYLAVQILHYRTFRDQVFYKSLYGRHTFIDRSCDVD